MTSGREPRYLCNVGNPLVIVESPAKARTIARFLGSGFQVESSIGHIRDLPQNAAEVPKEYKAEKWASLGVDTDNHFKPIYVVNPDKKDHVRYLKQLLKDADELYLATDEDREGEAIAWHLLEVLNPKVPVKRMVFHEITQSAIRHAIENPRELDMRLVDAQEARRIMDRLYGYGLSPVLWKKVMRGLSAGRVQSVTTRLIVERERERMAFRSGRWWDLQARCRHSEPAKDQTGFGATLLEIDGRRIATGKNFSSVGELQAKDGSNLVLLDETSATQLRDALSGEQLRVRSVERKPYTRKPSPPFMTSTLQQEAGRKLRMSAAQTMSTAQRLYENGFITYMRTDSSTLSETAINAARAQIRERYGDDYLPSSPRVYANKSKNAQEAHEAIRPAGETFRTPEQVASQLNASELRLYELIWQRTIASQMTDARGESVHVRLVAHTAGLQMAAAGGVFADGTEALFAASGRTIQFPGFLRAYVEGSDDPEAGGDDQERVLPNMSEGDAIAFDSLDAVSHDTEPPARFTEASLVKKLEEMGVGRPSTYASIISTIQNRGYVWKKGTALIPSFTAFAVVNLLERHFETFVDYAFTAKVEEQLDAIASGNAEMEAWLSKFYFGEAGPDAHRVEAALDAAVADLEDLEDLGLKALIDTSMGLIDARSVNSIPLGVDSEGRTIEARVGRYGPYIERVISEDESQRASIPDDIPPDELTIDRAVELLEAPAGDRSLGVHPDTGLEVHLKAGRFGPYVQEGTHEESPDEKPRTASLFKDMDPATVTIEDVLPLLALPRQVGLDPESDEPILAYNGKFGPYLKKGTDSRSLETEPQLLSVTLEEALRIFAEPKRRGRAAAKGPLREMGPDPDSQKPIVVKDGRFGPYVTDGETNASLRKGDSVEELTLERAVELLADRRARGPAKKASKKKSAAKKPAKKATAKKAAAKKPAKKAAAKKPAKNAPAKKADPVDDSATESGD